jgi:hypothetical protein
MSGEIDIRPLAAEDAAKLTECFERCYGDSYVVGFFYDPEAIRARMADGRVYSVVALTGEGEIVGHMAVESAPLPDLVFPEARGILDAALADRTCRPPRETSS